jgi:outer membrane protein TolC
MRWKSLGCGLALLLALAGGCKQQCFMTADDYNSVQTSCLGQLADCKPDVTCKPLVEQTPAPMTLYDLDRKVRYLTLSEAIAIALETGSVGTQNIFTTVGGSPTIQTYLDTTVSFTGNGVSTSGNDNMRVLSLDPARLGTALEQSLSRFDAFFTAALGWNSTDQPIGTALQNFQAGNTGLNAIEQMQAQAQAAVWKPLAAGGVAGITFSTPYTLTNLPARVNPSYQPQLLFAIDQPLLQGFGTEINQLRTFHPFTNNAIGLSPYLPNGVIPQNGAQYQPTGLPVPDGGLYNGGSAGGILIVRVRFDQQRAEFERLVNFMLANVERAYWVLYGAYGRLYAREQALRFSFETYKVIKAGYEAGRVKAADFYQTRGQYEQFRAQRLDGVNQVLENERQLRALLGLPIDDGCRLVPCDTPTLAPYHPDWCSAAEDCLAHRPELFLMRQEVKAAQLNVRLAKNNLLPDLRAYATYDFNSIGTRLDGPDENNAFRNLAHGNFSDWAVGMRMTVPIGYRLAHAQLRMAELYLAREMESLKDQERKMLRYLAQQYRLLSSTYELIRANRAQREAFGEQLRAGFQEVLAGRITVDRLLESMRFWSAAMDAEFNSVADYNNALAAFEFAKGTILQHNNCQIAEGPLPVCAQVRAVENERRRSHALELREHAIPTPGHCADGKCGPTVPQVAPTALPDVFKGEPPTLKEAEPLPAVEPGATPQQQLPTPRPEPAGPSSPPPGSPTSIPSYLPALPTGKPVGGKASDFGAGRPESTPATP